MKIYITRLPSDTLTLSVLLGYLWYSVVSLLQIIFVVNSMEYRALFGNDPLAEKTRRKVSNMKTPGWTQNAIENVKFYPSPDFSSNMESLKPREKNSRAKFQPTTISMGGQSSSYGNNSNLLRHNYNPSNRSHGYF